MKALVYLHGVNEIVSVILPITHIYTEGDSTYGKIRYKGKQYEVCQSTTMKHADGRVEKQWDIVGEINQNTGYISDDIVDW